MVTDKAGKGYWDNKWATKRIAGAMGPCLEGLNGYVNRGFHRYFSAVFSGAETRGMRLLEIGCARSEWLPYFAKEFGFKVYGLDYSEIGCEQTRQILSKAGVRGEVVCADLFSPPDSMLRTFDIVVSFGVVEHFEDTVACIQALSRFLKPDGLMLTNIPNLVGLGGAAQKILNRPVFDIHVPMDADALAKAHRLSDLKVLNCDYHLSVNFGVCNLDGIQSASIEWFVKHNIHLFLMRLSKVVWIIEDKVGIFKCNKLTSPYINCTARKPGPVGRVSSIEKLSAVVCAPGARRLHDNSVYRGKCV
jgi:2-polyprenyl-3-methyl-5-hydroxy-6-metoxy-1,4-benzoquinol methylase